MAQRVLWPFCVTWAMLQDTWTEEYNQLCTNTEKMGYRKINQ